MTRKLLATSLLVAMLMSIMVVPTYAQNGDGPPGTGWWVFWQIQNIDTTAGSIQMSAYPKQDEGGTEVPSATFNIDPGKALAYHPGLPPTINEGGDRIGFSDDITFQDGSAVISSDRPVVAIAQLGNNNSGSVGSGGSATAFYQGIGAANAATTVNFPLVKNGFRDQTTTFYIQAAGSDADVTITYNMNDGTTHTDTKTITANRMWQFSPSTATPVVAAGCADNGATSACQGAATVVSSSGPIVGVVVEHPVQGSPAPFALSTRGLTANDQGTKLLAPIIKNDFKGSTTGFSVQNAGTADANVKIVLTVTNSDDAGTSAGDTFEATATIAPGAAEIFTAFRSNLGGMPAGVFASAVVESTNGQPLVGAVNENNSGKKAVYAAFCTDACGSTGATSAKAKLAAPLVKELFKGKTTGLVVANAGSAPTKMRATYTDSAGVARIIESAADVPAGGAVSFFTVQNNPQNRFTMIQGAFADLFDTKNAVTVESTTGQPIVAVAQESARDGTTLDIKNYEGFAVDP